jgi:hypothetical protein
MRDRHQCLRILLVIAIALAGLRCKSKEEPGADTSAPAATPPPPPPPAPSPITHDTTLGADSLHRDSVVITKRDSAVTGDLPASKVVHAKKARRVRRRSVIDSGTATLQAPDTMRVNRGTTVDVAVVRKRVQELEPVAPGVARDAKAIAITPVMKATLRAPDFKVDSLTKAAQKVTDDGAYWTFTVVPLHSGVHEISAVVTEVDDAGNEHSFPSNKLQVKVAVESAHALVDNVWAKLIGGGLVAIVVWLANRKWSWFRSSAKGAPERE